MCVWDAWPLLPRTAGVQVPDLWMALSAPWFDNPDDRHSHARIELLERISAGWRAHGPAMPDGFSPGSREWSGSALLEDDGRTVTLYFTAAGRRGETAVSFEQRLFEATATLEQDAGGWRLSDWRGLGEAVQRDSLLYSDPAMGQEAIGKIKAFRDPGYFFDPVTGLHHLFFTASLAQSSSEFNGAIGVATSESGAAGSWRIQTPVLEADNLNNELERPHVVMSEGLYYLFWATQAHVFNPAGPVGPTGLYGMVSDNLMHGWQPLNGSGLVIANPPQFPRQAYSWLVMPDLGVTSFIDDWGRGDEAAGVARLGGTFAPFLRLALEGSSTRLVGQ